MRMFVIDHRNEKTELLKELFGEFTNRDSRIRNVRLLQATFLILDTSRFVTDASKDVIFFWHSNLVGLTEESLFKHENLDFTKCNLNKFESIQGLLKLGSNGPV